MSQNQHSAIDNSPIPHHRYLIKKNPWLMSTCIGWKDSSSYFLVINFETFDMRRLVNESLTDVSRGFRYLINNKYSVFLLHQHLIEARRTASPYLQKPG